MAGILQGVLVSIGGAPPVFVQEVFSTSLYSGNSGTQAISNGIDESGKGALTWIKPRGNVGAHGLADTVRGRAFLLSTNATVAQYTSSTGNDFVSFNSDGFTVGPVQNLFLNNSGANYVSWTFRKQAKFFDVITFIGNGASTQTISHALETTPAMIIIKRTSATSRWNVYHRSLTAGSFLQLSSENAQEADNFMNGANAPTSTTFTAQLGTSDGLNANGVSYIAYLFAHNAGGFGNTGTDNVISCSDFTTNGSGQATVTLGYEPQWVMVKKFSGGGGSWLMLDTARGMTSSSAQILYANTAGATTSVPYGVIVPTATGFNVVDFLDANSSYIYMTIRKQ